MCSLLTDSSFLGNKATMCGIFICLKAFIKFMFVKRHSGGKLVQCVWFFQPFVSQNPPVDLCCGFRVISVYHGVFLILPLAVTKVKPYIWAVIWALNSVNFHQQFPTFFNSLNLPDTSLQQQSY